MVFIQLTKLNKQIHTYIDHGYKSTLMSLCYVYLDTRKKYTVRCILYKNTLLKYKTIVTFLNIIMYIVCMYFVVWWSDCNRSRIYENHISIWRPIEIVIIIVLIVCTVYTHEHKYLRVRVFRLIGTIKLLIPYWMYYYYYRYINKMSSWMK